MRNWLEAGYFKNDLPVRIDGWLRFYPLGIIFPDPGVAFLNKIPPEPNVTNIGKKGPGNSHENSSNHAMCKESSSSKLIQDLSNAGNLFSLPVGGSRNDPSTVYGQMDNKNGVSEEQILIEKSTNMAARSQLKSLLGLSGQKASVSNFIATCEQSIPIEKLNQDQQQDATSSKTEYNQSTRHLPNNGWQLPTKETKGPSLSLREIMEQEELMHTKSVKNMMQAKAGTWAAKAALTSEIRSPYSQNPSISYNTRLASQSGQLPIKSDVNVREMSTVKQGNSDLIDQMNSSRLTDVGLTVREFGDDSFSGKNMTPEFSDWCSNQLYKIKDDGDLTLASFCLTIDSAAEIRETLATYLGSTPQVSQFATEFIKKKEDRANIFESGFQKVTKKKINRGNM
jgi:hypothetical protein